MLTLRLSLTGILLLFGWSLLSVPTQAGPREELLKLVPEDVGFCMVVNDLRGHSKHLGEGPLRKFQQSPLFHLMLRKQEAQKFSRFAEEVKLHLRVDWQQLRDDIFGDCVVFGYQHNLPNAPDQERGLLMLWAQNPVLLGKLIDRVNLADGVQKIGKRQHKNSVYFHRREKNQEQYYLIRGPIFVMTSDEPTIRQVIERFADESVGKNSSLVRSFDKLPNKSALATFWINPRAFDNDLAKQIDQAEPDDAQILKTLRTYWQALDAAAVSLTLKDSVGLHLSVQGRPQSLPRAATTFYANSTGQSDLWSKFPDDAVFTLAAHTDLTSAFAVLEEFMPREEQQKFRQGLQAALGAAFGRDFQKEILPSVGPDWGFCIAPSKTDSPFPDMFLAMKLQPDKGAAPKEWLRIAIFVSQLGCLEYNKKNADMMRLKTIVQQGEDVTVLESVILPGAIRPTVSLKDGYLLVTSSPQARLRFKKQTKVPVNPPIMRFSFQQLNTTIQEQRENILKMIRKKDVDTANVLEVWLFPQIDQHLQVLQTLELQQSSSADQMTWSLRLKFSGN